MKNATDRAGELLRAVRLERKMSRRRAAQLVGVPEAAIGHCERGDRRLTLEMFVRYASALGYPPHKVLRHILEIPKPHNGKKTSSQNGTAA